MDFLAPITDKLVQRKVEDLEAKPKNHAQPKTASVPTVKRDCDSMPRKKRWY